MEPVISLIIPVKNKSKFLMRCFTSIIEQQKHIPAGALQVIVVDDGSTDGSTEQCANWANNYGFESIATKNAGVAEARNIGMDYALGKYITFLDADDLLAPDGLAYMLQATRMGENIIQFGQYRCKKYADFNINLQWPYSMIESHYGLGTLPKYWVHVWNKLYKREFLEKNNIRFMPGVQFGEDTLFNMEAILENEGLFHKASSTVIHTLDDHHSLCRGELSYERIARLDSEMVKIAERQKYDDKIVWCHNAINQHRKAKIYKKYGYVRGRIGKYDVVYFVKDTPENEELRYSLRSLEENWQYRRVVFYGGCPDGLHPDRWFTYTQTALDKWNKVRDMITRACKDDDLTEDIWLFNDDFYVLKPKDENMPAQYNGTLLPYIERIERKQGQGDDYTDRLRIANNKLIQMGKQTLNYEVHKPMLINRKKALEVLERFPDVPAFRSLYGNYWEVGGENRHDMKLKILGPSKMAEVQSFWDFLSTSDKSFAEGEAGRWIRDRFQRPSRFEKEGGNE